MYSSLALVAVVAHAVSAVPIAQQGWSSWSNETPSSSATTTTSTASYATPASNPPTRAGNPFSFPLDNGFDGTLSNAALEETNIQAHGTSPNGAAPILSAEDLTSIQLIAFNEIFEVAFFTSVLDNVTNQTPGFITTDAENGVVIAALTAIQAQEELHAVTANNILLANGKSVIKPCEFQFPTTSLSGAFSLAKTFTDLVLGTLADVQFHLAINGAAGLVPTISSVIGQEGEQTGYFRAATNLIPSSQPFLTRAAREFAWSALNQIFVVAGTCPSVDQIALPIYKPLTVLGGSVAAADQTLSFSVPANGTAALNGMSLVYINSQNMPVVQNITNVSVGSTGVVIFDAVFPYTENLLEGLTIAALVEGNSPFNNISDVTEVTYAGPGLIEIN